MLRYYECIRNKIFKREQRQFFVNVNDINPTLVSYSWTTHI